MPVYYNPGAVRLCDPQSVYDARVVEFIGKECGVRARQRLQDAGICGEGGVKQYARLMALETRKLLLCFFVKAAVALNEPRRRCPPPVLPDRAGYGGGCDPGLREPEVIVAREAYDTPSIDSEVLTVPAFYEERPAQQIVSAKPLRRAPNNLLQIRRVF